MNVISMNDKSCRPAYLGHSTFVFTFGDLAIYQETGKLLIVPIEKIN